MPPTLIQTGGVGTLAAEGAALADTLRAEGVDTVHREDPGADHDFYCSQLIETVRTMLAEVVASFGARLLAGFRTTTGRE